MKSKILVSIIIPTFNSEVTIGPCLDSLCSSTYHPIEVVVIDDGSSDRTLDIAVKYNVKIEKMPENRGQAAVRNFGSKICNGEIYVFLDSDIVVKPETIALVVEYFQKNTHVSAITGTLSKQIPLDDFFSQYKNLYMNVIFSRMPRQIDFLSGSIFAIRRVDYLMMEEIEKLAEDTELGLRMSRAGKVVHLMKELEVIHLKRYTLRSLLKNDFKIPFYFGKLFVRHSRAQHSLSYKRFAHTSSSQAIHVIGTPILFLCFFLARKNWTIIAGLVFTLWALIYINRDLYGAYFKKGKRFGTAATLFSHIDMLVMALGMFCGLTSEIIAQISFSKKRSNEPDATLKSVL